MQDVKFNKILISINAFVPLILFTWDGFRGNFGANPVEFFLRTTGTLTLILLLITLAVSPLRKIFGWNSLIKYRRMLGLYAFFYGCLHVITYSIFDKSLDIAAIVTDTFQRPFIAVGMLAFTMMIPLAITSTNSMIKKMGGKRWANLHRLIYVIAISGVIHFYLIVKSDIFYPALFGIILTILLSYRFYQSYSKT